MIEILVIATDGCLSVNVDIRAIAFGGLINASVVIIPVTTVEITLRNRFITITPLVLGKITFGNCFHYFDGYRYFRSYNSVGKIHFTIYCVKSWEELGSIDSNWASFMVKDNMIFVIYVNPTNNGIYFTISNDLGKTFAAGKYMALPNGIYPILIQHPISTELYLFYYDNVLNKIYLVTSSDYLTWGTPLEVYSGSISSPFDVCIINYSENIFELAFVDGVQLKILRSVTSGYPPYTLVGA